jgi:hypothetical protein
MFKFRRLLCVVLVCALVGVAYGAARKIRSFTPMGYELATADGMAIVNVANGGLNYPKTIFQVVLSGFTPNTLYDVGIVPYGASPYPDPIGQLDGVWKFNGALTTDENGNGTWHGETPTDHGSANIAIYLYDYEHNYPDVIPTPGGFLRALGNQ